MKDPPRIHPELIEEISRLQQKIQELEQSESERKKAEDALKESKGKLNAMLQSIPDHMSAVDKELNIVWANATAIEMFGSDIIGKKCYEAYHRRKESCEPYPCLALKAFNDGEIHEHDTEVVDKEGKTIYFHCTANVALRDKDDKPVTVLEISRDITEHKRAEEALQESEERYRTIMEQAADAIFMHNETGRILDVNRKACQNLGYSREELLSKSIGDIDPEAIKTGKQELWGKVLAGEQFTFESHQMRKDGSVIPVEVTLGAVRLPLGLTVLGIVRDITDRKSMEQEVLRAQKLESLGILAGGIAHDFNNLMTVVLGNVQLAMMGLPANHTSYPLLQSALQSAEQTKDLTSRLITFSKEGFSDKQISNVSEVLREVVRKMVKRTGVRVTFDIEKDLWSVKVDENQIRQVFYNLTMNAVEAMSEGGTLTIQAHNAKVQPSDGLPLKEESYLRIIFADNGTGIAEEDVVRIFDPYFTTKGMGANKGVGLGLSVCYSVLKKHDGYIAVTSRPGEGTTFTLYLPALAEKAHTAKIEQTAFSSSPNRVLIMEDEIHVRVLERAFLERLGYEVTETGDGREAIDRYKEALILNNPFDLVILDLTVRQGLGGQLAMERLLKEDPSVKAVIASGYVDEPVVEHYKDYGFLGALKKPFSFEEFGEMVKKVIGTEA